MLDNLSRLGRPLRTQRCRRSFHFLILSATSLAVVAAGCQRQEEIRSYTVPREVAAGDAAPAAEQGEPTDRMLAAILPQGGQAWFFKAVGPIEVMDAQEDAFIEFVSSLHFESKPQPQWQLPPGWTEQPASGMRAATILIPGGAEPIELTVTALPWRGGQEELLGNVNRWRGQMQLRPTDTAGLSETTREMSLGDQSLTIVDLRGRFQNTMMGPMAGGRGGPFAGPGGRPPQGQSPPGGAGVPDGHPPIDADLPAGHPPLGATPAGATPGGAAPSTGVAPAPVPTFVAPASWDPLPAAGMRKVAFTISNGEQVGLVTVIDFPTNAGPMITDPLENINLWRRDVGLQPIERAALEGAIQEIDVDGRPATYAEIIPAPNLPEESQAPRATLGALVPDGERIWFFKLSGNRDLVAEERENFKAFLGSIRFPVAPGAAAQSETQPAASPPPESTTPAVTAPETSSDGQSESETNADSDSDDAANDDSNSDSDSTSDLTPDSPPDTPAAAPSDAATTSDSDQGADDGN